MKTQFSEKWKQTDFLSLVGDKQLSLPSYSVFDMTTCELIPLETLELWIYFSYILCYSAFAQSNEVTNSKSENIFLVFQLIFKNFQVTAMWKRVLSFNFTLTLFREETIDVFKVAEVQFEKVKNVKKIVKEMEQQASSTKTGAADIHRERRRYLRGVLKEATTLFHDQPGLLGNQILKLS